jgi:hypothetical protein
MAPIILIVWLPLVLFMRFTDGPQQKVSAFYTPFIFGGNKFCPYLGDYLLASNAYEISSMVGQFIKAYQNAFQKMFA